ncbi:MAG: hypothetical protein HC851_16920 [Acaryochloris sp. RU_4_1]|nr:hypothetical protein [Acaryochloris sp. RU_4_1]NJR55960.1 hypothetical protein [Acaryochloris sp. CRU_2_0]
MKKVEVLEALKQMTIEDQLEIIETASKLIRDELAGQSQQDIKSELSLAAASEVMRSFYEQGSELASFTDLDTEDFYEHEEYA